MTRSIAVRQASYTKPVGWMSGQGAFRDNADMLCARQETGKSRLWQRSEIASAATEGQ
jgi:hypothetical protein